METYIATLRPVSFCTLPEDIGRWEYAAQPETLDGGRYGIIRCRPLSKDEQSHFGLYRIDF